MDTELIWTFCNTLEVFYLATIHILIPVLPGAAYTSYFRIWTQQPSGLGNPYSSLTHEWTFLNRRFIRNIISNFIGSPWISNPLSASNSYSWNYISTYWSFYPFYCLQTCLYRLERESIWNIYTTSSNGYPPYIEIRFRISFTKLSTWIRKC
jgi:hypothetical protein